LEKRVRWVLIDNRILLFSSFAPFLVVFTHSIASHSQEDVALLSQFLKTLEGDEVSQLPPTDCTKIVKHS
jgi:hypothetical protein